MTTASRPPTLLIHGAWHSAATWDRVIPALVERGHRAVALDLPGHGVNARYPAAFATRPPDRSLAATEPSPVAAVTLDDYVNAVVKAIDALELPEDGQVVLVAHSMGGLVATAVAEQVPHRISKLIYLAAFMPGSGVPARTYASSAENHGELVMPYALADPAKIGAQRLDHASDTSYRAFYGDLTRAEYDETIVAHLSPDVPAKPMITPIITTPQRWGSIPRYYIKALRDMALRPHCSSGSSTRPTPPLRTTRPGSTSSTPATRHSPPNRPPSWHCCAQSSTSEHPRGLLHRIPVSSIRSPPDRRPGMAGQPLSGWKSGRTSRHRDVRSD